MDQVVVDFFREREWRFRIAISGDSCSYKCNIRDGDVECSGIRWVSYCEAVWSSTSIEDNFLRCCGDICFQTANGETNS